MAKSGKPMSERSLPWMRSGFDLEGIVGFLAGWLLGILLAMLWDPLFWLGFIPGIVILFATRTAERVSPEQDGIVVSPCDGVVVSIEESDAPEQLHMSGFMQRVRISSSPFATNNIHAPVAGAIDHVEAVEGAAENFASMRPDTPGLSQLFFSMTGNEGAVGVRAATGGLGPRLHSKADAGDRVEAGKTIAIRRLGGWCDVYVPAGGHSQVEPGQTLIGGESILWRYSGGASPVIYDDEDEADEPTELDAAYDVTPETVPQEVAEETAEAVNEGKTETSTTAKEPSDPSEMFARLRREASKHSNDRQD